MNICSVFDHYLDVWVWDKLNFVPNLSNSKGFTALFYGITHFVENLNSWERASIFLFECSVLNKGTSGTIFITSLVWCGPWLGIEPGTSCTQSQHYTTRVPRWRFWCLEMAILQQVPIYIVLIPLYWNI